MEQPNINTHFMFYKFAEDECPRVQCEESYARLSQRPSSCWGWQYTGPVCSWRWGLLWKQSPETEPAAGEAWWLNLHVNKCFLFRYSCDSAQGAGNCPDWCRDSDGCVLRWLLWTKIREDFDHDFFADKAMSYSEEMTSALLLGTARVNGKMNQKWPESSVLPRSTQVTRPWAVTRSSCRYLCWRIPSKITTSWTVTLQGWISDTNTVNSQTSSYALRTQTEKCAPKVMMNPPNTPPY